MIVLGKGKNGTVIFPPLQHSNQNYVSKIVSKEIAENEYNRGKEVLKYIDEKFVIVSKEFKPLDTSNNEYIKEFKLLKDQKYLSYFEHGGVDLSYYFNKIENDSLDEDMCRKIITGLQELYNQLNKMNNTHNMHHNDISTDNIMIKETQDGNIDTRLIDFETFGKKKETPDFLLKMGLKIANDIEILQSIISDFQNYLDKFKKGGKPIKYKKVKSKKKKIQNKKKKTKNKKTKNHKRKTRKRVKRKQI